MKTLSTLVLYFLVVFSSQFGYSQNDDWFTVVYNNVSSDNNLKTQWGYAAWIEKGDEVILFDTGTKSVILRENLRKLGLDPGRVNTIAISHEHLDHTGGLEYVLKQVKNGIKVYLPNDFNPSLKKEYDKITFIVNDKYHEITKDVWITEIFIDKKRGIKEQALIIEKGEKIIMITGCAHPGIAEMCQSVKDHFPDKKLDLVTGGFHLMQMSEERVTQISDKIKQLGFKKVAPSHCTGDNSIAVFQKEWKDDFVQLNLGDSYHF